MFHAPWDGILTNDWVNFVMTNYSGIFYIIPLLLAGIIKLIAIFDPRIPSDKILDWIKNTFPQKVKEEETK